MHFRRLLHPPLHLWPLFQTHQRPPAPLAPWATDHAGGHHLPLAWGGRLHRSHGPFWPDPLPPCWQGGGWREGVLPRGGVRTGRGRGGAVAVRGRCYLTDIRGKGLGCRGCNHRTGCWIWRNWGLWDLVSLGSGRVCSREPLRARG